MSLMSSDFGRRLDFGGKLLKQEDDNTGAAEGGKAERLESVLRSGGKMAL
jgi:hypothetical protein